jgi:hypothetical protein
LRGIDAVIVFMDIPVPFAGGRRLALRPRRGTVAHLDTPVRGIRLPDCCAPPPLSPRRVMKAAGVGKETATHFFSE